MCDQYDGHPGVCLKRSDQTQHLCLSGHIQGGRGFVCNQQIGFGNHRHRDHGALAHSAGHLKRIAVPHLLWVGESNLVELLEYDAFRFGSPHVPMQPQNFCYLVPQTVERR